MAQPSPGVPPQPLPPSADAPHPAARRRRRRYCARSWGDSWGDAGYFRLQADCKPGSRGARSMLLDEAITTVILNP